MGDAGDPDIAKALKTPKEVAENQTAFIVALKGGHMKDWRPVTEAAKAKLKAEVAEATASAAGTTS